jgi:hypothetical protein
MASRTPALNARRVEILLDVLLQRRNGLGGEPVFVPGIDVIPVVIDGRHPDRALLCHQRQRLVVELDAVFD